MKEENEKYIVPYLKFMLKKDLVYKIKVLAWELQPNLCITTTCGAKFLWSLQTGGRYKGDLCITAKTVNNHIWSLYKGSIIIHLITQYQQK